MLRSRVEMKGPMWVGVKLFLLHVYYHQSLNPCCACVRVIFVSSSDLSTVIGREDDWLPSP